MYSGVAIALDLHKRHGIHGYKEPGHVVFTTESFQVTSSAFISVKIYIQRYVVRTLLTVLISI